MKLCHYPEVEPVVAAGYSLYQEIILKSVEIFHFQKKDSAGLHDIMLGFHPSGEIYSRSYQLNGEWHRTDGPAYQCFAVNGDIEETVYRGYRAVRGIEP